jgi:hypothetical protein
MSQNRQTQGFGHHQYDQGVPQNVKFGANDRNGDVWTRKAHVRLEEDQSTGG